MTVPLSSLTDTWNAGGTTFTAIQMNVTDTASASGSLLMDLQLGAASKWKVDKAGNVVVAGNMSVGGGSNNVALLNVVDQTVSGGANVTTTALSTGNFTVDCGKCPIQSITNNGAYTITAPSNDGSCLLGRHQRCQCWGNHIQRLHRRLQHRRCADHHEHSEVHHLHLARQRHQWLSHSSASVMLVFTPVFHAAGGCC